MDESELSQGIVGIDTTKKPKQPAGTFSSKKSHKGDKKKDKKKKKAGSRGASRGHSKPNSQYHSSDGEGYGGMEGEQSSLRIMT